ncbi:MAG TPA: RNA polymerase sigma-54 factor, partial [Gammaproteobacteria bacterium]|nr:RNA polymerase sigma-54 factor [Gammaproteobacteria bacterium]
MNLSPRPVANIGQRLVLAPRQSESLQILALPATDLAALIAARLETNPLHEREEFLGADPQESDA